MLTIETLPLPDKWQPTHASSYLTLTIPPKYMLTHSNSLVDTAGLIEALWPDAETAPSGRTIDRMRKRKEIPHIRMGRLVYFDPKEVRAALKARFTVKGENKP